MLPANMPRNAEHTHTRTNVYRRWVREQHWKCIQCSYRHMCTLDASPVDRYNAVGVVKMFFFSSLFFLYRLLSCSFLALPYYKHNISNKIAAAANTKSLHQNGFKTLLAFSRLRCVCFCSKIQYNKIVHANVHVGCSLFTVSSTLVWRWIKCRIHKFVHSTNFPSFHIILFRCYHTHFPTHDILFECFIRFVLLFSFFTFLLLEYETTHQKLNWKPYTKPLCCFWSNTYHHNFPLPQIRTRLNGKERRHDHIQKYFSVHIFKKRAKMRYYL